MSVKIHFPVLPLQEAAAKGGGITRENAVQTAQESIQALSGEGDQTVGAAILALEAIVKAAPGKLAPEQLRAILDQADQVVTMAGTFGYTALDRASRGLCDIADGLFRTGKTDLAPVAVHVRAMRMFSPLGVAPPPEAAQHVLAQLQLVTAHYNFSSLDS